jgi:hypothetical protein
MTETYTPEPGDRVLVRRWSVPCPELRDGPHRELLTEVAGTVESVRPVNSSGVLLTLEGLEDAIFTGYQHSGQDPEHGCSWSLQTDVIRAEDVAAHDQAEHAARVAAGEAEVARALALWERARDAVPVARQRLTGAQERLEVIKRDAP